MWYRKARKMSDNNAFEKLASAGMARLLRHMVSGPFAILSADRFGMTPDELRDSRDRLKATLRDLGYGFVDTRGAWREETGEYGHEGSVFVPGIGPDEAAELGRALNQESVIVGDRGRFSFLDLREEGAPEGDEYDLARVLRIPNLSATPEMYTQIGDRKFEFRLDEDPRDTFAPGRIEKLRKQFEQLGEPVPAVQEHALVAHCYAGNPPPMMPKHGVRFAGSGRLTGHLPVATAMSIYLPFAARVWEELPRFDPSPRWGEPVPVRRIVRAELADVGEFVPERPAVYEEALGGLSQFTGGVPELFSTMNPGSNTKGFDSLYLGPSGTVFMLRPHTHAEIARSVLRNVHPDLPSILTKGRVAGGYSHSDLTKASGIQRFQIYRDGMGVTIEMSNPPGRRQLDAIRDIYRMTPMDRFVAEINLDGRTLAHLTSFGQLVHFVNNWDPDDPSSVEVLDPRLGELYDRHLAD